MSPALQLFLIVIYLPVALILTTIVARDMDARGVDGRPYGLLTFLALPVGLVVWLAKRARHAKVDDGR